MKKLLVLSLILIFNSISPVQAVDLPAVMHYALDVRLALKEQRVHIAATMTVKNLTKEPYTALPFMLYRLLSVEKALDRQGKPLQFEQKVMQLLDEPSLQYNEVVVGLPAPLQPNDSVIITLIYEGFIFGYPEVMAYVKDRIDEDYSLLRPDTFAYPVLAQQTFASAFAANDEKFTYDVVAAVPKDYLVACGGELIDTRSNPDSSVFHYRSMIATWRIDIAAAKFAVLAVPADKLVVYHLPGDQSGAQHVLAAAKNVIQLYSGMFGRPKNFNGYSIIEIPDGWGSQASDYYFLQTAAAFKDSTRMGEVYHEIGHTWNAKAVGEVQRCRWFDEAFASFFEALAIRAFISEQAFAEDMEKSRSSFAEWANYDRQVFDTPIAGYGKKEIGRHSYTKGAWSLYVLHTLVGAKTFAAIIRTMLAEFAGPSIDFEQFQKLAERISGRNLKKFFAEWIYGTESSRLLVDKVPLAEIVKRY